MKEGDEPLFMAVRESDTAASVNLAQLKLGSFRDAIAADRHPEALKSVKIFLEQEDGDGPHLWLGVKEMEDDEFICYPFEIPEGVVGVEFGKFMYVQNELVEDWMLNSQGVLFGGFSLRTQRAHLAEDQRAKFDQYIGVTVYSEDLP